MSKNCYLGFPLLVKSRLYKKPSMWKSYIIVICQVVHHHYDRLCYIWNTCIQCSKGYWYYKALVAKLVNYLPCSMLQLNIKIYVHQSPWNRLRGYSISWGDIVYPSNQIPYVWDSRFKCLMSYNQFNLIALQQQVLGTERWE